ncbi:MAG: hypothetical protein ABIQ31_15830 [Ferruginibacter sp.]
MSNKGFVKIRRDSTRNVPEPELTLVVTTSGKIIGYTLGNDMSSRSIEGEILYTFPRRKPMMGAQHPAPVFYLRKTNWFRYKNHLDNSQK